MEIRAGIGADLKNHTKYPEQPVSARAEAVAPEQPLKMDASRIKTELLAGLTVALALVPEAVAFAFVAGVNPLVGLYAAFFVGLITACIGGRPGMISGATGALAEIMQGFKPVRDTHPYWHGDGPESMLIDEVETIWAAIAESDDWAPLHDKVAALRRMGDAHGPPPLPQGHLPPQADDLN